MPINLISRSGFVASIGVTLDGASSDLDGSFVSPDSVTGVVSSNLEVVSSDFDGLFTDAPDRTGAIGTSLENVQFSNTVVWDGSIPDITFSLGSASSYDLSQHYTLGADEEFDSILVDAGTLPAGVTISGSSLVYDGGGSATTSGVVFRLNTTTVVGDWQSRSGGAGVFYSNNFDFVDTAAFVAGAYQTTESNKLSLDTTNKLSGSGSAQFTIQPSDVNGSGSQDITGGNWATSFDGVGATTKNTQKQAFYIQWSVRPNQAWLDYSTNGVSNKMAIIYSPDRSFEQGEVVPVFYSRKEFLQAYRLHSGGTDGYYNNNYDQAAGGGNFVGTNFINNGPQSSGGNTDANSFDLFQERYGFTLYGAGGSGGWSADDPNLAHVPRMTGDEWFTLMAYIDITQPQRIVKFWGAPRGQEPVLLFGAMDDVIPQAPKNDGAGTPIYSGVQFLLRLEDTSNAAIPTSNLTMNIDEVIASDDPIEFPGGFTAPFLGRTNPVLGGETYPFGNSSEFS